MNQYTYNFNSQAYEIEIPITELLWIDRNFAFRLYDACGSQLYDYQKINCQDFCPQNRIRVDFTNKAFSGCVDSYRDASLELIFSKWKYFSPTSNDIEIDNEKDLDGRKRIKKQGTHIGGHVSAAGEQFIEYRDHTTGCVYSDYFKVKECFNLWTWLVDNIFLTGGGSGGSDSGDCLPSEFKTIDKIINFQTNKCEEKLLCERTGKTKTEKYTIKKCDVQDENNGRWATIEYCELDCGYWEPIASSLPSNPGNGKCPDCILFANGGGDENEKINSPTCNESIINITMEHETYILFWQSRINEVNKLNGFSFKKSKNEVDFNGFSRFDFEEKVTQVRVDTAHNIYTISGLDTTIFQKYDISGNLQWSILLPNFQTKEISEGNLGNYSLIGKDQEINKWTKLSFTPDGTLVEVKGLPLSQQNYKIVHQSENTTIALQEDGGLAFATNLDQVTTSLPSNIIIKDIKTIENNKILVVGDFEGLVAIDSSMHNSNGFRNAIFLLFDKNGNFITSQSIQNNRNESVSGVFSHQSDEIAYHGYQNTSETDTQDSTFIISDSCLFVHVITLDYFCQRPAPELTFNEQTCQLIWNQSQNTEDLEIDIDGIWYNVEEYFNLIEEPVSPYSIIRDGYYRLVSRKTDCPTIYSNPIEVTCGSGSCPTIIMTEPEYQNNCWAFDIFSSSSKEIKFVIKTWQEDPSIIQFIDSLSFITNDSLTSFMYCELPPEYQCFNYGQINIECLDCDTICEPFIFDWACIPRMTNTQIETTLNNVIRFYPNPFSKSINLEISSDISEQVTLQAYNSIGTMVFEQSYDLTQGKNHKLIDGFEHVPSGVYTVKIKSKTKEFTARIIRVD